MLLLCDDDCTPFMLLLLLLLEVINVSFNGFLVSLAAGAVATASAATAVCVIDAVADDAAVNRTVTVSLSLRFSKIDGYGSDLMGTVVVVVRILWLA